MIEYEVIRAGGDCSRHFVCPDGHFADKLYYDMYEYLYYDMEQPHEIAEDAASWCEFATAGEEYDGDDFIITVSEREDW